MELILDVDVARAVDERFQRELDELVGRLREAGVAIRSIAPQARSAELAAPGLDRARLDAAAAGTPLAAELTAGGAVVRLGDETSARLADAVMQREARVTHDRLARLERFVPTVKQEPARLVVGIPAVDAATVARAKRLASRAGRLELRAIDPGTALEAIALPADGSVKLLEQRWTTGGAWVLTGSAAALEQLRAALPPSAIPASLDALIAAPHGDAPAALFLVDRRATVEGESVRGAEAHIDRATGTAELRLTLDDGGAARLGSFGERHPGAKIAVVLDGELLATPMLAAPRDGRVAIPLDGPITVEALDDLVRLLESGPLPARLRAAGERLVGPSRD